VTAFVIRRVIWTIPVLLLVIFLTFVMMKQIGGNPFRRTERAVPAAIQQNLERKFNLDEPWYVQYALYVKGVFTFDLGPSLVTRDRTVNDIIKEHAPKSIELGLLAFAWALFLGIPAGVIAALRHNSVFDYGTMFLSNVGFAVPNFLVATILIDRSAKLNALTLEMLAELEDRLDEIRAGRRSTATRNRLLLQPI
jgi:ABC-type dipeptide/oligopeptide/nickel transport system permease component